MKNRKYWYGNNNTVIDGVKDSIYILLNNGESETVSFEDALLSGDLDELNKRVNSMYSYAAKNKEKKFFVPFRSDKYNKDKKFLNLTEEQIVDAFLNKKNAEIPDNVIFHDSYKGKLHNLELSRGVDRKIEEISKRIKENGGHLTRKLKNKK